MLAQGERCSRSWPISTHGALGMNWRLKAAIQKACSALPWGAEAVYYGLQRTVGSLRHPIPPFFLLSEAVSLSEWLRNAGLDISGKRIMEVGTGRQLNLPFGFYLAGAASVDTFDLHRYLKHPLVGDSLAFMRNERGRVENIFLPLVDRETLRQRLDALLSARDAGEAMKITGIRYHAPADAAQTDLPEGCIDIHTSYPVFEHIPEPALMSILGEARRVLSPSGMVLHHIDPSDHFSHENCEVSPINFLQFSEKQWHNYAGNQFAYHNRLRADQYQRMFEHYGYDILRWEPFVDAGAVELLNSSFPLDPQFQDMSPEILCCVVLRVLARPKGILDGR